MLGHLELMRATGAFPKQLRREVQTIYREADRAAKIVRNLLVFAGSRRLARRNVSLPNVLQKVVALRQANCRALDIEVVRHYGENLPRVQSDPLFLHQVFLNIIMNAEHAIAATGRPGRIEISAVATPARDRLIATVRDTGDGHYVRRAAANLRAVLHDQGSRQGHRTRPRDRVRNRAGAWRRTSSAANHPEGGAVFTVELPVAPAAGR